MDVESSHKKQGLNFICITTEIPQQIQTSLNQDSLNILHLGLAKQQSIISQNNRENKVIDLEQQNQKESKEGDHSLLFYNSEVSNNCVEIDSYHMRTGTWKNLKWSFKQCQGPIKIINCFFKSTQTVCLLSEELIENEKRYERLSIMAIKIGEQQWRRVSTFNERIQINSLHSTNIILQTQSFYLKSDCLLVFLPQGINSKDTHNQNYKTSIAFSFKDKKWSNITYDLQLPECTIISGCIFKRKLFLLYHLPLLKSSKIIEISQQHYHEQQISPFFYFNEINLPQPHPQASKTTRIFEVTKKFMVLINPQSRQIWLLDVISEFWLKLDNNLDVSIDLMTVNLSNYELYAYSQTESKIIQADLAYLGDLPEYNQKKYPDIGKCEICYEQRVNCNELMQPSFKLSSILLDNIVSQIGSPFQAIGLLIDNVLNFPGYHCSIMYLKKAIKCTSTSSLLNKPCLFFEDDAKLNFTNEQLEEFLVNFQGFVNYNFNSVEKKVRSYLHKQGTKKQYGINLKLATFRLGSSSLFISINQSLEARICYCTIEDDECVCYYYVYDLKNSRTLEGYSDQVRWQVQQKFRPLIEQTFSHLKQPFPKYPHWQNYLWIFELKEQKKLISVNPETKKEQWKYDYELEPCSKNNDIMYIPNRQTYMKMQSMKCPIGSSIDCSLKEYISCLYIKNDHTKVNIRVENYFIQDPERRPESHGKPSADQNPKNNDVGVNKHYANSLNISKLFVNYHLKSINLFYNTNYNKNFEFFHPGILLYYKNRLIKRYSIPIGDVLWRVLDKTLTFQRYGCFHLYGIIELPDSMDINLFKNDFIFEIMVEKLKRRIKFIEKWVENGWMAQENQDIKDKAAKNKQNREKIIEIDDDDIQDAPQKKVKYSSPNQ